MPSMEERFEAVCAAKDIPGAILVASDRTGKFQYCQAFGRSSLEEGSEEPLKEDALMVLASCTKLMTSIAAMQCVERGQLAMDEDVVRLLPELKDIEILTGFDGDDKPILRRSTKRITLRHLLTHSSGMAYDFIDLQLMKWRATVGKQQVIGTTLLERFSQPLVFEPGTHWSYGPSIDWAGRMVERVNNMSLQAYMEKYLWEPLQIRDMTFFLSERPDLRARMPLMSVRSQKTRKVKPYYGKGMNDGLTECLGGQGVHASAPEFLKILHSLLADDETLLKRDTAAEFFSPNLTDQSRKALMSLLENQELNNVLGGLPLGKSKNWGLGGMLSMEGFPAWSQKGTLVWGGLPNLTWFIDREAGLCGMYASQILPPGDPISRSMSVIFERAMYERCKGWSSKI